MTTLFEADFDGVTGETLDTFTPQTGTFTSNRPLADYDITSGVMTYPHGFSQSLLTMNPGLGSTTDDFSVEWGVSIPAGTSQRVGSFYIMVDTDTDIGYYLNYTLSNEGVEGAVYAELTVYDGMSNTTLISGTTSGAVSDTVVAKVSRTSGTWELFIDDVSQGTSIDASSIAEGVELIDTLANDPPFFPTTLLRISDSTEPPAMSVYLAPTFGNGYQAFTAGGLPLNIGKLYTYISGGTTPQATWTTPAADTENANPIILGVDGRPPNEIWLESGVGYRFVLADSNDNVIATYDSIPGINDPAQFTTAFVAVDAGSAGAPSIRIGDADTGFYNAGNAVGVTVNGVAVGEFTENGLDITGDITATGDISAVNINASGDLDIDGDFSAANLSTPGNLTVTGTGTLTGNLTAANLITAGDVDASTGTIDTFDSTTATITNLTVSGTLTADIGIGEAVADLSVLAVGSYVFCQYQVAANLAPGDTVNGADLRATNAGGIGVSSILSGTWMCCGLIDQGADSSGPGISTLFKRLT